MSTFGSGPTNLGQPSSTPKASWRYVMRHAVQQSGWNRWREPDRSGDEKRVAEPISPHERWKPWALILALVVLLSLPISYGVIEYLNAPGALRRATKGDSAGKSLLGLTRAAKPKPDPGKPVIPPSQQPRFTNPAAWTPAAPPQSSWVAVTPPQVLVPPPTPGQPQTGQPQASNVPPPSPSAARTAPPPSQPVTSAKPGFIPDTYPARHDKLFGDSCVGQLTLNAAGLSFNCPGNPSASVQVPLNQIGAVDQNGILLNSGKKYHFSIRGMSKDAEQQLFSNWLRHIR